MTSEGMVRMRATLVIASALLLTASATTLAQGAVGATESVKPASADFTRRGFAELERGQPSAAMDHFETALAVDPSNRSAFIGMARAAQAQGLPGKAVKFYREALSLDPNDLTALEGQGAALVQRGSTARAQVNLARIRELCGNPDCPPAKRLASAIQAGPPAPVQTAQGVAPKAPSADN